MRNNYLRTITSAGDPDMSREAMSSYMIDYPDFMESSIRCVQGFRGDTLQSCGWTFGSQNKYTKEFNPLLRSYGRLFNEEEIKVIDKFRLNYHCIANFAVLPQQINIWRGAFREGYNDNLGNGQCDYFDIFLNIVRSYYLGINIPNEARSQILKQEKWLDWFGKEEKGWSAFISYYNFNPYVNSAYEVKDLFAMPCTYQKTDCKELLGVHHGWNFSLPLCSVDGKDVDLVIAKQRALNFVQNSLWIWQERSKLFSTQKSA